MSDKSYLDHKFPVIQHTAIPARLDASLQSNLNDFLPRALDLFEKIIVQNGESKKSYRFFKAHHMAIALTPQKVVFCLDCSNATLFLTALYCFELEFEINQQSLDNLIKTDLDLNDVYFFEAPRSIVENPGTIKDEILLPIVTAWYEHEQERINMSHNIMKLSPKVFTNTNVRVKADYCFVLMPFLEELTEVYEDCIKTSINESKMECKRADDIFHNSSIVEVIWTEICAAEVIIADLTGKNPNVFYELGIAHTLGKETIMITQNQDDVPFDLRHLRYIEYSNTGRGLQELKKQLVLTIGSIRGTDIIVTKHG